MREKPNRWADDLHGGNRTDVLDDIDKYGDFNRDVQIFNAQLGALDERLWRELEVAVKDEGLSMQDALLLMGKFEGISGRDKTGAWKVSLPNPILSITFLLRPEACRP